MRRLSFALQVVAAAGILACLLLTIASGEAAAQTSPDRWSEPIYNLPCSQLVLSGFDGAVWAMQQKELIDPAYPVSITLGDQAFHVPWGYLGGRPLPQQLHCQSRPFYGVQFWIPSLDAPERDLSGLPEFKPSEARRPTPGPDEYVVKASISAYTRNAVYTGTTVDERIKNVFNNARDANPRLVEDDGLLRLETSVIFFNNMHWQFQNTDLSFLIERIGSDKIGYFDRIYVDFKDISTYALIQTYTHSNVYNKQAVYGLRDLLARWKYSDKH